MAKKIFLEAETVHLWQVSIPDFLQQLPELFELLTPEEVKRAKRYKFKQLQQRFAIARAMLRNILHLYTEQAPNEIEFKHGARGKPYLLHNPDHLQFNVSHSHDAALYAIAQEIEVGVDIEFIEEDFDPGVAERFFSPAEYTQLMQLPETERNTAFYQMWADKEAVIKSFGEGLYAPLQEFTVDVNQNPQTINLTHQATDYTLYLEKLNLLPDYRAALAALRPVHNVMIWRWTPEGFLQE